ncbi:MAG TPA: carbohydrate-binding protein, partial [Cytophagaceae bacterium]|nr:carbohydrate-binding protein [Cytophagaceae bacterium]
HYKGHEIITTKDLTSEMHIYTLIWDENSIKWYLDDSLYNECYIKEPIDGRKPFNEDFFFIVSGGVGSDFSGKKIDHKLLPQTFEVDYIRVYKKFENPFIISAAVAANGNEVEVLFSEHLKEPDRFLKDFELRDNNQLLSISSASMKSRDNRTLLLRLSSPITKNSLLTLSYKGDSIRSFHNLALKKINSLFISNNTTGSSPVPLSAATKDDFTIALTVNKNLEQNDLKQEDFFARVNGKEVQFQTAAIHQTMSTIIDLRMKNPLFKEDTILLYYRGGNPLLSIDKGILQPFSGITVTNLISEKFRIPGKIEAENYTAQQGMMSESCNDEGGGRNLGYIEEEDWLEYTIYVAKAGKYQVEYRTSSKSATGVIVLRNEENILTRTTIEPTTNWQLWNTTKSDTFILEKGIQKIKLTAAKGGFNINWFSIVEVSL